MCKPVNLSIVCIICLIPLSAADQGAFAQAGSTGGTIGKQDKSISGGEQHLPPSPQSRKSVAAAEHTAVSRSITGEWSGAWGVYHLRQSGKSFTWTIGGAERAHGTINGNEVQASWSGRINNGSGKGVISKDGNTITWDNGNVFRRR
jgi:hypothetical protein